jgi:hypothetical protein
MTIRAKIMQQFITCVTLVSITVSCSVWKPHPVESHVPLPTAPATLPEVIDALLGYSGAARVTAAYALPRFGEEAVVAIPALIQNLHYETTSDVRKAAAFALGELGSGACDAVPDLLNVLHTDDSVNVRRSAAEALGKIGDPLAIPALVGILYEEDILGPTPTPLSCTHVGGAEVCDYGKEAAKWQRINEWLTLDAAIAIALITGEDFPDADSQHGYRLNEQGVLLIVIAARAWWEEKGQFQDWGDENY